MPKVTYQAGFGNHFQSEALKGALPRDQNNPQRAPYGLYAEQLSGTTFLAPRHENQRSWLYRIFPAARQGVFKKISDRRLKTSPFESDGIATPEQLRWDPLPLPKKPTDFVDGLVTISGNGSHILQVGCGIHLYAINRSMQERYFYSADGDCLVVPEQGGLTFATELGLVEVKPGEIFLIPRGIRFQVRLAGPTARGYVCENYGPCFRLPNLGPIGANGLASPRHFLYPTAHVEEKRGRFELIAKFQGGLWAAPIDHSPLDVVAWHGNYAPYKYDLSLFNTVNSVSFDHLDPSIFTVLTAPSEIPHLANVDFVIFPPRWMVAEHTFRPPYYHRNLMSEYMGLIFGVYDAKPAAAGGGFVPGGGSLHNCMSGHGPDAEAFEKASNAELKPVKLDNTLAFMFESRYPFIPTQFAIQGGILQQDYLDCWQGLKRHFNPRKK